MLVVPMQKFLSIVKN